MWKKIKPYVISVAIALLTGAASALLSGDMGAFYDSLNKPPLAPPAFLFPIVWTVLYVLMGLSSGDVYKRGGRRAKKALCVYGFQLFVNFFWSILFFRFQALLPAFIWLILLWILVLMMIYEFSKISERAANLQIPYLLWITFAGYLNFMFYIWNI